MIWFRVFLTGSVLLLVLYFQFFFDFSALVEDGQETSQQASTDQN